jgi:peptide/nickel transport system permease protein
VSTTEKPEVVSAGAGLAATVAVESHGELGEADVRARGYWEQVWLRFKRDKWAIGGGIFVVFLILAAYAGGPIASHLLGHGPNDQFTLTSLDKNGNPTGPWSHIYADQTGLCAAPPVPKSCHKTLFVLGSDSELGRDEFLRILYGAQVSLEVAVGATVLSMIVGVLLGAIGGYYGGWVDMIVSRLTEIVMAFPYLLFVIALSATVGERLNDITFGFLQKGVFTLAIVIGLFSWFYPARIVRAQVLSLREKEFVEAARMVGASDFRIIRSHLLPHLVAPIIVYSTLIVAQNILFEAGLSFLGVGIPIPTASWGSLLEAGARFYTAQPWLMLWPGLAVLLATLAFNLLGDGLRDAFDPRSSQ